MQRSIVLITVDCLRADHVGFLGYHRPTTPFLDTLAAESFSFANAIVAGAPTYYSFPGILGSRHPLAFGRDLIGLTADEPTPASVLEHAGYATAAFIAGNPYLSRRFGYDHGFATFEGFVEFASVSGEEPAQEKRSSRLNRRLSRACQTTGATRWLYDELYFQYCQRITTPSPRSLSELRRFPTADVLVDRALEWLRTTDHGPFFLWLHLMDPHAPYYPHEQALRLMGNQVPTASHARYVNACWNRQDIGEHRLVRYREEIIHLYDAGIRWADTQVARLVDALRTSGRWEDCLFAVTADHGEELLDHGGKYHAPSVHEELIRVPLLLRAPGSNGGRSLAAPFSLLHLAPTLLEAAGAGNAANFQGSSYWPHLVTGEEWDGAAIVECVAGCTNPFRAENRVGDRILAVREKRFKLSFDFRSRREQLFDLEADPGENFPLPPGTEPQARQRLLKRAYQHIVESHQLRDSPAGIRARVRECRLELASPAQ